MMISQVLLGPIAALILAPLMLGIINRTKAFFAGRRGPPAWQLYIDLAKLLRKGPTYSRTTSWVFRAGPIVSLAAYLCALCLLPLGNLPPVLSFAGDLVLLAYLLGLARFMTVCAALDTGSAFEGMGASREVQFSSLVEPALFVSLAAISVETGSWSLFSMFQSLSIQGLLLNAAIYALVAVVLMIVFLTENARLPIDDPNTHLELTMIHEVMVLDHSGPDLAFIQFGAALKMWVLGLLLIGVANPLVNQGPLVSALSTLLGLGLLAVLTGVIESIMARFQLIKVPKFIAAGCVLAVIALTLAVR